MNSHYEKIGSQVRCIDDEIPFELPNGWEWCRLGTICGYIHRGKSPIYGTDKTLPIIAQKCNQWDKLHTDRCLFADAASIARYSEEQYLQLNDILINSTGTGTVGRTGFVSENIFEYFPRFVADSHVTVVRCFPDIFAQYIYRFLVSPQIQIGLEDRCSGSTNQKELSSATIANYIVPLPPLAEQHRIVAKLEQILPLVEKYGKEQDTLERLNADIKDLLKKSILQEAIQGRLVPQNAADEPASELLKRILTEKARLVKEKKIKADKTESFIFRGDDNKYYETIGKNIVCIDEEIPFEIPDSWCWTRLAGIAELYTGDSINEEEKKLKFMTGTGRYYIGTKDVGFDHKINYKNGVQIPSIFEPVFRMAPKGSVLMCVEGGSAGRKIAILNETVCFGNKLCCFSPFGEYAMYIYYYLQSPAFFSIFSQNKTGIIGGVSLNTLKSLIIPLPPKQEINRIVQKIDELFAAIN